MKSVVDIYRDVEAWCEGGPTPDPDEVREAFQTLIEAYNATFEETPTEAGPQPPNVVVYDPRFKDPEWVKEFTKRGKEAVAQGAPMAPCPVSYLPIPGGGK